LTLLDGEKLYGFAVLATNGAFLQPQQNLQTMKFAA
jgi:hypothetical protein